MNKIKKGFNRNHLIIMALGNIIGSGIFLGSSTVIGIAGPAAVISYLIGGLIMTLQVLFVTEMSVINPAPGSFRVHASEIFGPWIGFVNGWMFWFSGIFGMAGEVTAAAIFTRFWFPKIPLWVFCIVYTVIMAVINLNDAKGLSRIESFLASIKVIALVLFILFGLLILTGILHFDSLTLSNPFRSVNSFLPKGFGGIASSMILVLFSYTGTGIIGLAIADTDDPGKNAPPAISVITVSVIALYVLSVLFMVLLTPWQTLSSSESPFVLVFHKIGIPFSDSILNFIVLSAALSGLNTAMYSSSRMLNSLSRDGQAPKLFLKTNKNHVPAYALGMSTAALLVAAVLSYLLPEKVFILLAGVSGFLAMINWATIAVTHYFYRKKTLKEHPEKLKFKVPGYPYTSFFALLLIAGVFITAPLYPGQVPGLIGSVVLLLLLLAIYFILKKTKVLH